MTQQRFQVSNHECRETKNFFCHKAMWSTPCLFWNPWGTLFASESSWIFIPYCSSYSLKTHHSHQTHHPRLQKTAHSTKYYLMCGKHLQEILSIIASIFNYTEAINKANEFVIKPRANKRWQLKAVFNFGFSVCVSWCNYYKSMDDFISTSFWCEVFFPSSLSTVAKRGKNMFIMHSWRKTQYEETNANWITAQKCQLSKCHLGNNNRRCNALSNTSGFELLQECDKRMCSMRSKQLGAAHRHHL